MTLAGDVAVEIVTDRCNDLGARSDLRQAWTILGEIHPGVHDEVRKGHLDALAQQAWDLLTAEENWRAVETLAGELLERTTVTSTRVREIIGSSRLA